jgi:two-component system sensor kinase FixL
LYAVRVQRKLAERELELRRHLVEMAHTNRLTTIGQMVVELTHEINQPLYAIDNFAKACLSMLRDDTSDSRERALQWTGQIATQARRASEIIRRLRRFVQSDSPLRAPADVNDIVRDVIELLEIDPRLRGVRIATQWAADLPPPSVDRIQIEQVLVNLLVNAAEASHEVPPEFRKITVATRAVNGDIEVAVRDEGCGMPHAARERKFEAYYTTKADGMGMGLAISRSLIEEHGGRLWAEQNRDRGLTFRFTLPIAGAARVPQREPARLETQGANA